MSRRRYNASKAASAALHMVVAVIGASMPRQGQQQCAAYSFVLSTAPSRSGAYHPSAFLSIERRRDFQAAREEAPNTRTWSLFSASEDPDYFADYDDFIEDLEAQLDDDGDAMKGDDDDQMRSNNVTLPNGLHHAFVPNEAVGNYDEIGALRESDDYDAFLARLEKDMKEGWAKELMSREGSIDSEEESHRDNRDDDEDRKHRRDPHDNKAKLVDEAAVVELLELRNKARRRGDYGLADELRDELISLHGVYVWDRERIWTTNPASPAQRSGRGDEKVYLNRHGHDYAQVGGAIDPDKCNLGLQEIHNLLAKLSHFELAKEFNLANDIRSKLIAAGVKIENRTKQWRADGGSFTTHTPNVRIYTQNKYSTPVDDDIRSKIESLLQARVEAKKARDFDRSDDIEEELYEFHDVILDHRDKTWTVAAKPYRKSPLSLPLPNAEDEDDVRTLLSDRFRAIRARDYKLANFIKRHLYDVYDVTIDDKRMQWSSGGKFESAVANNESEETASSSRPVRKYVMRGSPGGLSRKDIALVEALVSKRSQYLASFDLTAAQAMRKGLLSKFNVHVDDLNQEFCVGPEEYTLSPMQKELPSHIEKARKEIESMIQQRSKARSIDKDFEKADIIRDTLFSKFAVRLDDRTKEWWYCLEKDMPEGSVDEEGTDDKGKESGKDQLLHRQEHTTATGGGDSSDEAEPDTMTLEFLKTLTVPQLKERLREAGLPLAGRKTDLIERLIGF